MKSLVITLAFFSLVAGILGFSPASLANNDPSSINLNFAQQLDIYLSRKNYDETTQRFLAKAILMHEFSTTLRNAESPASISPFIDPYIYNKDGIVTSTKSESVLYEEYAEKLDMTFDGAPLAERMTVEAGLGLLGVLFGSNPYVAGGILLTGGAYKVLSGPSQNASSIVYKPGLAQNFLDLQREDPKAFAFISDFAVAELNFGMSSVDLEATEPLQEFRQLKMTEGVLVNTETLIEKSEELSKQILETTEDLKTGQNEIADQISGSKEDIEGQLDGLSSKIQTEGQTTRALVLELERQKLVAAQRKAEKEKKRNEVRGGFGLLQTAAHLFGDESGAEKIEKLAAITEQVFKLSDGKLGPIAQANVYAGIAMTVLSFWDKAGISQHQQVMEAFQKVFEAIQQLSQQMNGRFDSVDAQLAQLFRQMDYGFSRVDDGIRKLESDLRAVDLRLQDIQKQMKTDKLVLLDAIVNDAPTDCFGNFKEELRDDPVGFRTQCFSGYAELSGHKGTYKKLGISDSPHDDFTIGDLDRPFTQHLYDLVLALEQTPEGHKTDFSTSGTDSCQFVSGEPNLGPIDYSSPDQLVYSSFWLQNVDNALKLLEEYPQHIDERLVPHLEPMYCHGSAHLQTMQQLLFEFNGSTRRERFHFFLQNYASLMLEAIEIIEENSVHTESGFRANATLNQKFKARKAEKASSVFGTQTIPYCRAFQLKPSKKVKKNSKANPRKQVFITDVNDRTLHSDRHLNRPEFQLFNKFYTQLQNWHKWTIRFLDSGPDPIKPHLCMDTYQLKRLSVENFGGGGGMAGNIRTTTFKFKAIAKLQMHFGNFDWDGNNYSDYAMASLRRKYHLFSYGGIINPASIDSARGTPVNGSSRSFRACSPGVRACPHVTAMIDIWNGFSMNWKWGSGHNKRTTTKIHPLRHKRNFGKLVDKGMTEQYRSALRAYVQQNFIEEIDSKVTQDIVTKLRTGEQNESGEKAPDLAKSVAGQIKLLTALIELGIEPSEEKALLLEALNGSETGLLTAEELATQAIYKNLDREAMENLVLNRVLHFSRVWDAIGQQESTEHLVPKPLWLKSRIARIKSALDVAQAHQHDVGHEESSCGLAFWNCF